MCCLSFPFSHSLYFFSRLTYFTIWRSCYRRKFRSNEHICACVLTHVGTLDEGTILFVGSNELSAASFSRIWRAAVLTYRRYIYTSVLYVHPHRHWAQHNRKRAQKRPFGRSHSGPRPKQSCTYTVLPSLLAFIMFSLWRRKRRRRRKKEKVIRLAHSAIGQKRLLILTCPRRGFDFPRLILVSRQYY